MLTQAHGQMGRDVYKPLIYRLLYILMALPLVFGAIGGAYAADNGDWNDGDNRTYYHQEDEANTEQAELCLYGVNHNGSPCDCQSDSAASPEPLPGETGNILADFADYLTNAIDFSPLISMLRADADGEWVLARKDVLPDLPDNTDYTSPVVVSASGIIGQNMYVATRTITEYSWVYNGRTVLLYDQTTRHALEKYSLVETITKFYIYYVMEIDSNGNEIYVKGDTIFASDSRTPIQTADINIIYVFEEN